MSKILDEFQDFGFFEILGIFEKKPFLGVASLIYIFIFVCC